MSETDITLNQQIKLALDFSNDNSDAQPFAYVVQIQDEDDVILSISYIVGSLGPGQSLDQTLSSVSYTHLTLPPIYSV